MNANCGITIAPCVTPIYLGKDNLYLLSYLPIGILILLFTRVRGASLPRGMQNSKNSAVVLRGSLIRLKGRAMKMTGLHIESILMITKTEK